MNMQKALLTSGLVSSFIIFSIGNAFSQSEAIKQGRQALEERQENSTPGEGMMTTNPDFFDKSDAANQKLRENYQEAVDPTDTTGAIEGESVGSEGDSDAMREQRKAVDQN
ncbi:hypothetical protein [Halomonas salina]|uniref:hypothetical protein n=1 Tax=Halomonas salina TaxID=42565 RepID=UPI001267AC48|nr:hypothetical protein [Halomonas salina]